jgi:hypothetical protein
MTTHHRHARRGVWGLLLLLVAVPAGAAEPPAVDGQPGGNGPAADALPRLDAEAPRPAPITPPSTEKIDAAIRRGVDFLVGRQNPNGSWGSARNTKDLNIYAPAPGAHHAFRAAVTGLCLSALIESGDRRGEVAASIDRGEAWMFEHMPSLRRATPDAIYNTWGHAYGIQGLASMYRRHADDPAIREKIKGEIQRQIELLGRYECVDGGWCYYDMKYETQKPSGPTLSFVTATVLVALNDAKGVGVEVPKRLVDRGMESIRRQRKADFTYLDEKTTPAVMRTWLDRLFARNLWLDIGRKRPIPHESWFQVAGYFFYYGHYYAAATIEHLEPAERPHFRGHLAHILLGLQEKDGCWWDYPLYDYHQQYGTALAVMSLVRCKPER